uniref:Arp2/3 complex 34 kDa subunit n=1 Tax=Globodera pallida TaxID=36090 RepID=A0A183C5K9_GLOPA
MDNDERRKREKRTSKNRQSGEGERGYITFVLFPRHTNKKARDNTISLIHTFRDYLHYHIKCSKVYLHSRMRSKTNDFLKVLNRALPETKLEKKTISGRTFVQH